MKHFIRISPAKAKSLQCHGEAKVVGVEAGEEPVEDKAGAKQIEVVAVSNEVVSPAEEVRVGVREPKEVIPDTRANAILMGLLLKFV